MQKTERMSHLESVVGPLHNRVPGFLETLDRDVTKTLFGGRKKVSKKF
jgi:hypothetical protein